MKQRIALLLAGVLVGALLMTVLPVSAHHGASSRRLQRQINVLKQKTQDMDRQGFYNSFIIDGQVLSVDCPDGAGALWVETGFDVRALSCAGAPAAFRASERAIRNFKASHR